MNLRKLLRVARWEISNTAGTLDRRSVLLGVAALALVGSTAVAGVAGVGTTPNDGLYRVGVTESSPFHTPVDRATELEPVSPSDDRATLRVVDTDTTDRSARVVPPQTQKAQAALSAFGDAVRRHNTQLMNREENQSAAFPVRVTVQYVVQSDTGVSVDTGGDGDDDSNNPSDGATTDAATPADDTVSVGTATPAVTQSGDRTTVDGQTGGDDQTPRRTATAAEGGGLFGDGDDGAGSLFTGQTTGSPAEIAPPFPFGSLILAFLFLVPMNFIVQAYGSTILNERIDRRGELLLVAPLSALDIVAGKTLPYLAALGVTTVGVTLAVDGGVLSVLAVFPVALVYLGATFLGAMFARSFKELTFVTVTITVFVTTYVFVPAIFTTIIPVALISPLTLVVRDLQTGGVATTLGEYLFSTGPFYVASGMLFLLGAGIYREEDMFTQRRVPAKLLDALDAQLSGRLSVLLLSAALIPFVFVAELLGIAVLVTFPEELTIPVLLLQVAVVEEVAKSLPLYAAFQRDRFERSYAAAVVLGVLSGVGFFLGEKATAIAQVVGLDNLPLGEAALAPAGLGPGTTLGLLAAPLALHVTASAVAAIGATRTWRQYLLTLGLAIGLHFAYDIAVVVVLLE